MGNVSLAEAIRYLNAGFTALLYMYILNQEAAGKFASTLGLVGLPAVALAFGAVVYVVYRAFYYNPVGGWLQDSLRKKSQSYRTFFIREYSKHSLTRHEAVLAYVTVRSNAFPDMQTANSNAIANVHNGYVSALLAIPFGLSAIRKCDYHNAILFLILFIVIFIAAFLYERRYQDEETTKLLAAAQSGRGAAVTSVIERRTQPTP